MVGEGRRGGEDTPGALPVLSFGLAWDEVPGTLLVTLETALGAGEDRFVIVKWSTVLNPIPNISIIDLFVIV